MARTIRWIKAAMRARGSHWWDKATFEHWGTVVYPAVHSAGGNDAGQYFVTSEQDEECDPAPRFTVQRFDPATTEIHYAPGHAFKEFATHAEADEAARTAATAEKDGKGEKARQAARDKRAAASAGTGK